MIRQLDLHADLDLIADAVRQTMPRAADQQELARALKADPSLLTGNGHPAPVPAIVRLIDVLHDAEVAGIVRPACHLCRQSYAFTGHSMGIESHPLSDGFHVGFFQVLDEVRWKEPILTKMFAARRVINPEKWQ